jgi:hypothetical protein
MRGAALALVFLALLAGCSTTPGPGFEVVLLRSALTDTAPANGTAANLPCDPIEAAMAVDLAAHAAELSTQRRDPRPFRLLVLDEVATGRRDAGCSELPQAWTGDDAVAWSRSLAGQRVEHAFELDNGSVTVDGRPLGVGLSLPVEGRFQGNVSVVSEGVWSSSTLRVVQALNWSDPAWRHYWWP